MPFTPAHPAIVLPFINKRFFSATALVIGSISPDFEYFFKASVNSAYSHTIGGILYFDLPVTIIFSFVFHLLIKENLITNLPELFQKRLVLMQHLDFRKYFIEHYIVVIYCALLGAASHIFWDGFTHNGAFFVNYFEVYKQVKIPFLGVNYPLFYALQQISTIIGLIVIVIYIVVLPVDSSREPVRPRIGYWLLFIFLGITFFALRFTILPRDFNFGNAVVTGISSVIISLCILGYIRCFKPVVYQKNRQP